MSRLSRIPGWRDVTLIKKFGLPEEQRLTIKGHVQPQKGIFEVDAPVHQGDVIEVADPRGGVQHLPVANVKIHQYGSEIDNLEVEWGSALASGQGPESGSEAMVASNPNPRAVFVVHGRNLRARDAMFTFLRTIGLQPIEWSEATEATGRTAPYIGEILDAAFSRAQAVVVLLTPDDEARLRVSLHGAGESAHETQLTPQARPNVLFEAGMAMGRNPNRTILVELGALRPFSDVAGRHAIKLDNTPQKRHDLASRLRIARCPVNLDGTDWFTAGDFEECIPDESGSSPLPNAGLG